MKQLTLRGFDKDLERRLRDVAKTRGVSLNQAALILLREGAGLEAPRRRVNVVGNSLDDLIGSWSKTEEVEFLRAISSLEDSTPRSGDEGPAGHECVLGADARPRRGR